MPHSIEGKIEQRGLISCFEPGLQDASGQPIHCEASAIAFVSNRLLIASDKAVPGDGLSAVFSFDYIGSGAIDGSPSYLTAAPFIAAVKYEDMTVTPDGKHVIATTGFDRVKKDSNEWDGYNTLLSWPVGQPDEVRVVLASDNEGVTSSLGLRKKISKALLSEEFPDEVPYFKVESLAVIPGNQLLFGIRELGVTYDRFVYTFKIIAVPYEFTDAGLTLGDFVLIYDFDIDNLTGAEQSAALSSIEYDPYHERLYLLTSYETQDSDEGLGGYLWTLPIAGLNEGTAPSPVKTAAGTLLQFAHKPEGVTVLSEDLLLIIHDDDRVLGRDVIEDPESQFSRQAHQAAWSLVSLSYD